MDFGLGLILSFTDNATSGINNAVNSLSQLTYTAEYSAKSLENMASLYSLSVIADQLGSSFLNAGGTIISTLSQVIGKVNETGQTLMYAENQLNALYANSGKTGKQVIGEIQEYAKTSMFEFENLIPAVTSLKSVGIEAFDSIASSTGEARYSLLDYASALASFAPQMRNAYGTGINAAIGAMREYIAEGNALSLKRGAGLDITGILGEDKGATIEDRTRQVADLIETLNMMPMVDIMSNSPMTKLSNMGDTLFQFTGMVAESGVYEAVSNLISIFSDFVMSIDDDRLQNMAKIVGGALSSLIKPVEWLAKKIVTLADGLFKLLENNPSLAKLVVIGSAVAGVLLVLAGVALKLTSAFSGLSLMLLTMGKSFKNIGGIMKTGILKILGTLLPFIATISLLSIAWKNDFAGIKTNVSNFVANLGGAFKTAKQAVSGSVDDLTTTLTALNNKGDFFSNLTIGIMKVMTVAEALADAWGDYTLSEDIYLKAKELGVLPLIEAILDLKYRFEFFKQGFIDGWNEISENVKNAVSGFLDNVDGTALGDFVDNLTSLFDKLSSGDTQSWYDFGKSFANFTAYALAFVGAIKTISTVIGIVTSVVGVFKTIWGAVKSVVGIVSGWISSIGTLFGKIGGAIKTAWGIITTVVTAIGTAVTSVLGFFGIVVSAPAWVVGAITLAIAAIVALIVANWDKISAFLSKIGTWIYDNVIKPVADFFVNLWEGIVEGVSNAIEGVKSFLGTVADWIYSNVIQPVVDFFMTYIYPFIEKIAEIVAKIIEIVVVLTSVFVQWLNTNVVQPIIKFFQDLWNKLKTGVQNFISSAQKLFGTVAGWINTNVIQPISKFFSNLWQNLVTGVQNFINKFVNFFNNAVTKVKAFFSPLVSFFRDVWDKIVSVFKNIGVAISDAISGAVRGAINSVLSGAASIINGFISAINTAISVLNAIPGVSIGAISYLSVPQLATGGVIDKPTTALIGEAGAEAVVPLENNLGWIDGLAGMIVAKMSGNLVPTNTSMTTNNSQGDTNQRYLTTNNSSSTTYEGDTDNSIIFNEGAIQVNVQNASDEEAFRLAKKILEYIKRQKELDRMMCYA